MCLIWTWKCKHIFQASSVIFSHCYSIKRYLVLLSSVFFFRKNTFFNVGLQIAPCLLIAPIFVDFRTQKRVTFFRWTLQKGPTSHKVTLFSWAFLELLANCYSQGNRVCCEVKKQSNHASNKWGALMKHCGRWLPFEQHLFVPKHVTLSQKMRLALLVSIPAIPAPCFFDQQAVHDKKSKGDIRGFPNWDWKIAKESLSFAEHCKKAPHHTKWPCFLEPFSSFLRSVTARAIGCVARLRNRVTMQATSGELWWSTVADDSHSSSIHLFQSMWHYRRRCV